MTQPASLRILTFKEGRRSLGGTVFSLARTWHLRKSASNVLRVAAIAALL
jgi:hypothetical protein